MEVIDRLILRDIRSIVKYGRQKTARPVKPRRSGSFILLHPSLKIPCKRKSARYSDNPLLFGILSLILGADYHLFHREVRDF